MNFHIQLIILSSLIFFFSILFFSYFKIIAKKLKLTDHPTPENVHEHVIPTGSGIIFFLIFQVSFIIFFLNNDLFLKILPKNYFLIIFGVSILCIVSFYDDLKKIHPVVRLAIQITIIMLCISTLYLDKFFLPLKLTIFLFVYFWVYLINVVNFTDGSDGFLATNSIIFFLSIILLQINTELTASFFFCFFILPSILGYLIFNKPPAKIFMGDSGSIFLGFFIGYISLETILNGYYNIVISLLAYPLIDCTYTLIKKTLNGNYPWARMFDYYFLLPIKKNKNHKLVFNSNLIFNVINFMIILTQIIYGIKTLCTLSLIASLILINYFRSYR